MRTKLVALLLVTGLAGAVAVVAAAKTTANGLPKYTNGYTKWTKLNAKPITAPGAHTGVKNVYVSKDKSGKRYPNGTVVVKSIAEPRKKGLPKQVAVMRKVAGKWQFVEYQLDGSRYGVLAKGALCQNCHMQAKAKDYVFTVAAATPDPGLPRYTSGYAKWTKLNKKPITAPGAHTGVKNVYASKTKAGKRYPNGTVVVKSIAEPGKKGLPKQVAVMRKVAGKWQFVEYELDGSRYGVLAKGAMCQSCHMRASANDFVYTKR